MTWHQLLAWINDPSRTIVELRSACTGLGLPPTGNASQVRNKLLVHVATQNLGDPAAWTPPAPVVPVTAPAAPAPATTTTTTTTAATNRSWLTPVAIITAAVLLFFGLLAATDSGPFTNTSSTTTPTTTVTTAPTMGTQATPASATDNGTASNGNVDSQYGLNPQPQIGHPSMYVETGVPCSGTPTAPGLTCNDVDDHTRNWKFTLQAGSAAVIGGFKVDGVSDGVYKTIGSGNVDTTVTDGFVAVVEKAWLCGEFNFRVGQAETYRWARQHVSPPSGCASDASSSGSTASAPSGSRQVTGNGKTLPFKAGQPVIGVDVKVGNKVYHSCYLADPSANGTVTTGVIYPNKDEIAAAKAC